MASKSSDKLFEKAAFGYRPEEVDRYIDQLNEQIRSLEAEKADLVGKMKVLAEKINEYRQDETNLKDALLGAQKMGNAIVKEAQAKADAMVADAKNRSERMLYDAQRTSDEAIGGIRAQVEHEKLTLAKMQKSVADFKSKLLSLYKVHLNAISSLPDMEEEYEEIYNSRVKAAYVPPQPVSEVAAEPQPAEEPAAASEAAAEPQQQEAPQPQEAESTTMRFDPVSKSEPQANPGKKQEDAPAPTVNRPAHKLSFEEKFGDLKFGKNNPSR
ncbi:MAG: DivIVA domain-containing protein [Candidatus Merdivicinus sp.]|jgi:cell division initiation protein